MKIEFSKWHGTGNDFILIDDRKSVFPIDSELIQRLCDRHFGIGSDGLILIQEPKEKGIEFHMEFINPDASRSFCGNGSRCAYAFWSELIDDRSPAAFTAFDGKHEAEWREGKVAVTLAPVDRIERESEGQDHVNTGSPHELVWVEDPDRIDVVTEGRKRRYDPKRMPGGTNVNFITVKDGSVRMRTYERGVENETLSCGTGVVAAALSALSRDRANSPVKVIAPGGELLVEAERKGDGWHQIRLIGPAIPVFQGWIEL